MIHSLDGRRLRRNGPVVEVALDVIRTGDSALTHYDLSEDATWGLGIGCGGSVDVRARKRRRPGLQGVMPPVGSIQAPVHWQ